MFATVHLIASVLVRCGFGCFIVLMPLRVERVSVTSLFLLWVCLM